MNLEEEIKNIVLGGNNYKPEVIKRFTNRLDEGFLTRDENESSHFCCYFLPYNPSTKQVFIVHHKKSGLWLAPGGHVDKGENLLTGLNREINEELGLVKAFLSLPKPFLITLTSINNPPQTCREHLDIWFILSTDGSNFDVDPQEFHTSKWVTFSEAQKLVTDKANLEALSKIEQGNL